MKGDINWEKMMIKRERLKHLTIGLMISVFAFTGLLTFSPVSIGSLGAQKAAACGYNKYQITWGQVGVRKYRDMNSQIIAYKYYGQIAYGPPGGSYYGMTSVDTYIGPNYVTGYIPDGSRNYLGCA